MKNNPKTGFTLVELSIVLVIIGLLIGGVLIGKSLIESAKINRFVSDLQQYEIATIQFHKKFKKYPGDSPYFTPPGTGDNVLGSGANGGNSCAAAPNAALSNREENQFWPHLSQAQMLKQTYVPFSPQGTCTGGVHGTDATDPSRKLVAPYITLDSKAAAWVGATGNAITVGKANPQDNLYFRFNVNAWIASGIEKKLNVKPFEDFSINVGLVNIEDLGNCYDEVANLVLCTDPSAAAGEFLYFIPPQ